jgi:hypothetical protein
MKIQTYYQQKNKLNVLLNEKSNKKAFMINLLAIKKTAQIQRSFYINFWKRSLLLRNMVKLQLNVCYYLEVILHYNGRVLGDTLIEYNVPFDTKGKWEAIGIIEYTKAVKMLDLEKMPGYSKALLHQRGRT